MTDFTPNSNARILITLTDGNRVLESATVRVTVTNPSGTTIVNNQLASEEGEGVYSYNLTSVDTAQIGTYFITWDVSAPITLQQKTTVNVGWEAAYSLTLLDVRHSVASLAEGKEAFWIGEVTNADADSLSDTGRIEPDKSLTGAYVYIYAGNGLGQEKRVLAKVGTTMSTAPDWGITPTVGDLYELHRHFSVADINRAIRQAVSDVADVILIPITSTALTLIANQYEYEIPAGFSHLFDVQICIASDFYKSIAPAAWSVLRNIRKVKIHPNVVDAYSGQKLRLLGLRPPTLPLDDSTGVDVKPSYVIKKASAYLCFSKMQGRENEPGGWSMKHQYFEAEAMAERNMMGVAFPQNIKRVD